MRGGVWCGLEGACSDGRVQEGRVERGREGERGTVEVVDVRELEGRIDRVKREESVKHGK